MRGKNITNIYIIEGKEYHISELSQSQLQYINTIANKEKYNIIRNFILENEGDDIIAIIKIIFPEQQIRAFDEHGIELIY